MVDEQNFALVGVNNESAGSDVPFVVAISRKRIARATEEQYQLVTRPLETRRRGERLELLKERKAARRDQTNSMSAISAPSPLRGPSLTIRVYPPGRSS